MRRQGVGSRLIEEADGGFAERSKVAGSGFGLYADYGAAQRLYVKRGYVPDGRGLVFRTNVLWLPASVSPWTTGWSSASRSACIPRLEQRRLRDDAF